MLAGRHCARFTPFPETRDRAGILLGAYDRPQPLSRSLFRSASEPRRGTTEGNNEKGRRGRESVVTSRNGRTREARVCRKALAENPWEEIVKRSASQGQNDRQRFLRAITVRVRERFIAARDVFPRASDLASRA